jgi:DNA polymerase-3 subunit chi
MTEIRFYHLNTRSLDQALPEIVQKALSIGHKIIIRAADDKEVERLSDILWTFRADSFIPHGSKKDGHPEHQPVWLCADNDNANAANVLIVTGGNHIDTPQDYSLLCDMFDGRNEDMVIAARKRFKAYKDSGHTLTYWQQTDKGWEQKA